MAQAILQERIHIEAMMELALQNERDGIPFQLKDYYDSLNKITISLSVLDSGNDQKFNGIDLEIRPMGH